MSFLDDLTTIQDASKAAAKEWKLLTLKTVTEDLNQMKSILFI